MAIAWFQQLGETPQFYFFACFERRINSTIRAAAGFIAVGGISVTTYGPDRVNRVSCAPCFGSELSVRGFA